MLCLVVLSCFKYSNITGGLIHSLFHSDLFPSLSFGLAFAVLMTDDFKLVMIKGYSKKSVS